MTAQSQKADYYDPESLREAIPPDTALKLWFSLVELNLEAIVEKQLSRSVFPQKLAIAFACSI